MGPNNRSDDCFCMHPIMYSSLDFLRQYRVITTKSLQWQIYIVKFWRPPSKSFNFMQFLGKFGKIVCWRPPPQRVGTPSSGKSWICHCLYYQQKAHIQTILCKLANRKPNRNTPNPMGTMGIGTRSTIQCTLLEWRVGTKMAQIKTNYVWEIFHSRFL